MNVQTIPNEDRPTWGRGVLASYEPVTAREIARRATDASGLTFPLPLVILIVCGFLCMGGTFWIATSAVRSDVRDIGTRMDVQREVQIEKDKTEEVWRQSFQRQLEANEKKTELLRLEFEQALEQNVFKKGVKP